MTNKNVKTMCEDLLVEVKKLSDKYVALQVERDDVRRKYCYDRAVQKWAALGYQEDMELLPLAKEFADSEGWDCFSGKIYND